MAGLTVGSGQVGCGLIASVIYLNVITVLIAAMLVLQGNRNVIEESGHRIAGNVGGNRIAKVDIGIVAYKLFALRRILCTTE